MDKEIIIMGYITQEVGPTYNSINNMISNKEVDICH